MQKGGLDRLLLELQPESLGRPNRHGAAEEVAVVRPARRVQSERRCHGRPVARIARDATTRYSLEFSVPSGCNQAGPVVQNTPSDRLSRSTRGEVERAAAHQDLMLGFTQRAISHKELEPAIGKKWQTLRPE